MEAMARFFPIIPSRALQSTVESLSAETLSPSCLPKEERASVHCLKTSPNTVFCQLTDFKPLMAYLHFMMNDYMIPKNKTDYYFKRLVGGYWIFDKVLPVHHAESHECTDTTEWPGFLPHLHCLLVSFTVLDKYFKFCAMYPLSFCILYCFS